MSDAACQNTDTPLFQEVEGDALSDSCHMTRSRTLGIDAGGKVQIKPLREWASAYEDGILVGREQVIDLLEAPEKCPENVGCFKKTLEDPGGRIGKAKFITADGFVETRQVTLPLKPKMDFAVRRKLLASDLISSGNRSLNTTKRSYTRRGFDKDGCALYVEET